MAHDQIEADPKNTARVATGVQATWPGHEALWYRFAAMDVTRRWLCPIDGMIDLPGDTDRCPLCGVTALDPTDPANRDAIDEARQLHTGRNTKGWMIAVLVLFIVVGTGTVTWFLGAGALNIAMYAFALGGAGLVTLYASRRDREWRGIPGVRGEEGRALRRWTSTIAIACVICVGFVPRCTTGSTRLPMRVAGPPGSS